MTDITATQPAWLYPSLACPRDHAPLFRDGATLKCEHGHIYPVVREIPVLLVDDVEQTVEQAQRSLELAEGGVEDVPDLVDGVEKFVQEAVAATNGRLYARAVGNLGRYPIPELRLPDGDGRALLDIGCNWGRWTIAAARKGYRACGIDPNLEAVLTARRVTHSLGIEAAFVVGDARFLPFADHSFDTAFSYSVIQHFSKTDARGALREVGRVLRDGGESFIQMPNAVSALGLYHRARRGFSEGQNFDVRYWRVQELLTAFTEAIGPSTVSVDGFFGLGIQGTDLDVVSPAQRLVIHASDAMRRASLHLHWLVRVADSVYIRSTRRPHPGT